MSTSLHPRPLPGANSNPRQAMAKVTRTKNVPMPWLSWNVKLAPQWALSLLAAVRRVAIVLHPRAKNQLPRQPTPMLSILIWTRIRKGMFSRQVERTSYEDFCSPDLLLPFCSSLTHLPVPCILSPFPVLLAMNYHPNSDFRWLYHSPLHFKS